jgi:hypothetical protein
MSAVGRRGWSRHRIAPVRGLKIGPKPKNPLRPVVDVQRTSRGELGEGGAACQRRPLSPQRVDVREIPQADFAWPRLEPPTMSGAGDRCHCIAAWSCREGPQVSFRAAQRMSGVGRS